MARLMEFPQITDWVWPKTSRATYGSLEKEVFFAGNRVRKQHVWMQSGGLK
jgi:hypothetical protein